MLTSLQISILILGFTATAVSSDTVTVTVEQGNLLGETVTFKEDEFINVDKQINIFKGIPFAEPPVGELRFESPVAKTPWEGVWNGTYDRPVCHQAEDPRTIMFEQSEDCLFLTVYAPNPTVGIYFRWGGGGGIYPKFDPFMMVLVLVLLGQRFLGGLGHFVKDFWYYVGVVGGWGFVWGGRPPGYVPENVYSLIFLTAIFPFHPRTACECYIGMVAMAHVIFVNNLLVLLLLAETNIQLIVLLLLSGYHALSLDNSL